MTDETVTIKISVEAAEHIAHLYGGHDCEPTDTWDEVGRACQSALTRRSKSRSPQLDPYVVAARKYASHGRGRELRRSAGMKNGDVARICGVDYRTALAWDQPWTGTSPSKRQSAQAYLRLMRQFEWDERVNNISQPDKADNADD